MRTPVAGILFVKASLVKARERRAFTIIASDDFKEAGEGSNRLVVKTVAYCLTTTFIACLIGLAYALLILIPNMPDGLTYDDVEMEPTNTKDVVGQIEGIIQGLIPKNIVLAGASTNLLGVIFFFTVVGYTIEHTAARPSYLFMALKDDAISTGVDAMGDIIELDEVILGRRRRLMMLNRPSDLVL